MLRFILLLGTATALAGCGKPSANEVDNNAAANAAAAEKPQSAYCFFKDSATKEWKAKLDKSNVVVSGRGYAEDPRYKAVLSPATVNGTNAEIAPTLAPNDTGYASPDNWWAMSRAIPASEAVTTVTVQCGDETVATLKVPRKK
jgi:hypothetical protein